MSKEPVGRFLSWCSVLLALIAAEASAQTCNGLGAPQFSNVIHVTVTGSPSGTGTQASPVNLQTALTMVGGNTNKIYIQAGTYVLNNPINIPSNVDIIGGWNAQWVKDNSAVTTLFRDATNPEMNPPRLVALYCIGRTNFRLQDLSIRTANAMGQGVSTYGLYLRNCSDYNIVRCRINAGNGGNGNPGAPGSAGLIGAPGDPGQPGYENTGGGNNLGGQGGSGTFPGSNPGGRGGNGGQRGTYNPAAAFPGQQGETGGGAGGGAGGAGGLGNEVDILPAFGCSANPAVNNGYPGEDGTPGNPGVPGVSGVASFNNFFFTPSNGTAGTIASNGAGGGGGGGGGSLGGVFWWAPPPIPFLPLPDTIPANTNGTGAGGGGGGEGGQAGTGGGGGQGAGGSFAVFVWDNGNNGRMKDCIMEAGLPGIAGVGGIGGAGGQGGDGGIGINWDANCHIGAGAPGGKGGNGGNGGNGGAGSDAVSHELYHHPGSTAMVLQNIYGLSQPIVNVRFSGCTNAPVTFSTNSTGTIQWFFGAGAVPNTIQGQTATVHFTTPGFKTFTLVVNGIAFTYTDFVDIHAIVPALDPNIVYPSLQFCAGDVANFSSSQSADLYTWQLSTTQDTVTYSGPNFFNLNGISFDTAGLYQLTLYTETTCCGRSYTDTIHIAVDPIILPAISIQSDFADSTNTVCELNEATFTALAVNPGPTPTFQWQINGNPAGPNSPVFTTSALTDGATVTCVLTSSLGCATGETAESNGIQVNVIDPITVTCASDSFLSSFPTFFEASVVSGGMAPYTYLWSFGDGTMGAGVTVAHIYQNQGNYTATVTVKDSLGCSATCQTVMTISPSLFANFSVNQVLGCAPVEVEFTNLSINAVTHYWDFGDGSGSNLTHPSHTYITPGTYNVTMWAYSGIGNDSLSVSSQVVVYPTPVANFQMYANFLLGGDTVQFADNSLFADTWLWNFGNPASGAANTSTLQNPVHIYPVNSTYTVTLTVSNSFGCTDQVTNTHSVTVGLLDAGHGGLRVYPNPASDVLFVELGEGDFSLLNIAVVDAMGRHVLSMEGMAEAGRNRVAVPLHGFSDGIYSLRLEGNGRHASVSFVVRR